MLAPGFWFDLLAACSVRLAHRRRRLDQYADLVGSGDMATMAREYASQELRLDPPVRRSINRSGGRRKVLFLFQPREELFQRGINAALRPLTAPLHSQLCHSFQPGRGVRTAYRQLLGTPGLDGAACLRLDIRDYFNSIRPHDLLDSLPSPLRDDLALRRFLEATLLDQRVVSEEVEVLDDHKGVMAGTPLAPLLSNLYLRALDTEFESSRVAYLRYADDFLLLGTRAEAEANLLAIEGRLGGLGLRLNPDKTRLLEPGQPWEFLGLRYQEGALDLASNTVRKMHHRVRRLARKARSRHDPLGYFVHRLNRRVFGVGGDPADFTWATWFFPMLSGDATLRRLDALVQDQLRFAVTGRHERRNRGLVPYARLREAGYLPLVSGFHAYRRGPDAYASRLRALESLPIR